MPCRGTGLLLPLNAQLDALHLLGTTFSPEFTSGFTYGVHHLKFELQVDDTLGTHSHDHHFPTAVPDRNGLFSALWQNLNNAVATRWNLQTPMHTLSVVIATMLRPIHLSCSLDTPQDLFGTGHSTE
jgi:hypothetical protein